MHRISEKSETQSPATKEWSQRTHITLYRKDGDPLQLTVFVGFSILVPRRRIRRAFHAVGVESSGGGPVGEDANDAHILREDVKVFESIAIVVSDVGGRLIVPSATGAQRAGALESPGDETETSVCGGHGKLRGCVGAVFDRDKHLGGGRVVVDAFLLPSREILRLRAHFEGAVTVHFVEIDGLGPEGLRIIFDPVVDVGLVERLRPDVDGIDASVDVFLDELFADFVIGFGDVTLRVRLELGGKLAMIAPNQADALRVAEERAAGCVQVGAEFGSASEEFLSCRRSRVVRIHLSAKRFELLERNVRSAAHRRGFRPSLFVGWGERFRALGREIGDQNVGSGVQVALRVTAHEFAVGSNRNVALDQASSLVYRRLVPARRAFVSSKAVAKIVILTIVAYVLGTEGRHPDVQ